MKHIRIEKTKDGFRVSIDETGGRVIVYPTRYRALRAAAAWAVAHGNYPIDDRMKMSELHRCADSSS